MVNQKDNALGIIFPNAYDRMVPELTTERLMASIPFAGRYRMIDFILSSMVNNDISNINILVRENYHSLVDHLESGRSWDLVRKNGGLNIFPPYSQKGMGAYHGRIEALESILSHLRSQKETYVVMSDTNIAVNFNFKAMIRAHIASGADVTVAYTKEVIADSMKRARDSSRGLYYTLNIDENGRVNKININPKDAGAQNMSMNIYVMKREWLIDKIDEAFLNGKVYFERDILAPRLDEIYVNTYLFEGYYARITDMHRYFEENMRLLDDENLDALFEGPQIYTKVRDDNPTRYINGSSVSNVLVADGCVIEGTVENSILFRGVKVGKGAVVKNSILMQDTIIERDVEVDYLITDKQVEISAGKVVKGNDSYPVYIAKRHKV
ncbi:MAG: glucose-1-phosphate adenylyltransferase subunit GlgD [Lachnospiraceae bacterium]|nr:glucose-1-phosphate adenylyltransferase subunit GlgD [Lachnospiraceae bacterium]